MRSRNVILTLLLLVGVLLFAVFRKWQEPTRKEPFDRNPQRLRFYAFARCRMQCLTLTENDIKTIMQKGVINLNKSNRAYRPCPVFAVQGRVRNAYLRIVFEQCRNSTYVVNCFDLQRNVACDCPTEYNPKQD